MATKIWIGGISGSANDAGVAGNWSPSGVPATTDDVVFDGASSVVDCTAGLDQSAKTYDSLTIYDSYTGLIGTATAPYQCGATIVTIHKPSGISSAAGSRRINLDLSAAQTTCSVHGSASDAADVGMSPIRLIGTHVSNALYISGPAIVGVAAGDDSEVATFADIGLSADATGSGPTVTLGVGCTLTDIDISAGDMVNRGSNVNTIITQGGTYTVYGSATHTALEVQGGVTYYNSNGTLTSLLIGNSGNADFSRDPRPKTVTTTAMQAGGALNLNNGNVLSITLTNGIDLVNCAIQDVSITTWADINLPAFTSP